MVAVFGCIKHNMNFKNFILRGIDKVNVEIGQIAMVYNLNKFSLAI
ncbi:transposase [Polaribacter porphyrae]|nr:transposase [Polaribacter porphyrae]